MSLSRFRWRWVFAWVFLLSVSPSKTLFAPEEQYVYSSHPIRGFRSSGAVCGVRTHNTGVQKNAHGNENTAGILISVCSLLTVVFQRTPRCREFRLWIYSSGRRRQNL